MSLLPHLLTSSAQNTYQLHVFADNLFTSVELAQYLFQHRILYTGNARSKSYGSIDARFKAIKAFDDSKKSIPSRNAIFRPSNEKSQQRPEFQIQTAAVRRRIRRRQPDRLERRANSPLLELSIHRLEEPYIEETEATIGWCYPCTGRQESRLAIKGRSSYLFPSYLRHIT